MIPIALHAEVPPALVASAGPRPPAITAPRPREVSFGLVAGRARAGTVRVRVLVNGVTKASQAVDGPADFSFFVDLPSRDHRVAVVAEDAAGGRSASVVRRVYGLPREGRPRAQGRSLEDPALARRVRALARGYPGISAVYVQDLRTGRGAAWNARARFPAASTVKVAIAVDVLRRLGGRPAAGSSLDRLLWRMLVYSDNESANRLLVWLGGSTSAGADRVNALLRSLGIGDTLLYGGYATAVAAGPIPLRVEEQPAFGIGKYTTAWDLARLHRFVHLAAGGLGPLPRASGSFGRADARYLLWILAHVADRWKLDRFLPGSATVLHKAGWLRQARHDAGLIYWRRGSYVVTVLTWNPGGAGSSADVLAGRVARAALDRFRRLESGGIAVADLVAYDLHLRA